LVVYILDIGYEKIICYNRFVTEDLELTLMMVGGNAPPRVRIIEIPNYCEFTVSYYSK